MGGICPRQWGKVDARTKAEMRKGENRKRTLKREDGVEGPEGRKGRIGRRADDGRGWDKCGPCEPVGITFFVVRRGCMARI